MTTTDEIFGTEVFADQDVADIFTELKRMTGLDWRLKETVVQTGIFKRKYHTSYQLYAPVFSSPEKYKIILFYKKNGLVICDTASSEDVISYMLGVCDGVRLQNINTSKSLTSAKL